MDLCELHFGVEIETVRRTRKRVAEAIQSVVGGSVTHPGRPGVFDPWEVADAQGRTWKVVSDGSLGHVPSHLRAEVVTPVLAYGDILTLQEVIRAVRKCGAKVDRHCGIHVHVDASRFDGRTLGNLATRRSTSRSRSSSRRSASPRTGSRPTPGRCAMT